MRTVVCPHLQTSLAVWTLALDSELVFVGGRRYDRGRPAEPPIGDRVDQLLFAAPLADSRRRPVRLARPLRGSGSGRRSHTWRRGDRRLGRRHVDSVRSMFGSVRPRYFGPRALVEDDSVRSKATSLVNPQLGYGLSRSLRLALDVFNLFNARNSDIDYFYRSRLPGEPPAASPTSTLIPRSRVLDE